MKIPRMTKRPSSIPAMLLALIVTFALSACYENQISNVEFETTKLTAIMVADPVLLTKGMEPYQELSKHHVVVLVHRSEQIIAIPGQRVRYNIDAAFINEKCKVVRVLTGIPPLPPLLPTRVPTTKTPDGLPSAAQPEPAPDTFYSSGYPAKYLAIAISPILNDRGVRPGQKVKFTGPASRAGCD